MPGATMGGATEADHHAQDGLLPRGAVILAAYLGAAIVAAVAILGPLALGILRYRTSQSGIWQTMGVDAVNLLLIVPALVIGATLLALHRDSAKYLLILAPLTLFSLALEAGVGEEWGNPAYTGNVERYAWLFILEIVVALVLLIGTFPMFGTQDVPRFGKKGLRIYVALFALLLALFTVMWLGELAEVTTTGNTASGSYANAPVVFWAVRFMDLGVTIPLGFIGLYLLLARVERAYPLVLLFFGFFVTMGTEVTAMALVMAVNQDPEAQAGGLVIFPLLTIMAWAGLLYLVKDKIPWPGRNRSAASGVP